MTARARLDEALDECVAARDHAARVQRIAADLLVDARHRVTTALAHVDAALLDLEAERLVDEQAAFFLPPAPR